LQGLWLRWSFTITSIGVSAFSQNRKRLEARMEADPLLRKRFERAGSALNISK
jgi:hypothetical protein